MNLRQQIIQNETDKTATALGVSNDLAFLRFAHSIITNTSLHAFEAADLVEGGQDKQIDVITIDQSGDEADIHILGVKNAMSFSSNDLIRMRNGLLWIFNKTRADLATLTNTKFRDRILEYRSIQGGLGPSNLRVTVCFVTNGLTSELSDEFKQEAKTIIDDYDNGTFAQFNFQPWGADELVNRINLLEKHTRRIDADISIRYDANNPSLIKYHAQGLKGVVCSANAREIARIVNGDPTGSVFDLNIRRFLGIRGGVNSDILRTCTEATASYLFWFLNNGITVVCDSFDPVTDPDDPKLKIKNMQIVNGCQTATALAMAESDGKLLPDSRVMLRIYETTDSNLVERIVLTTNNQNRISSRDLRANDQKQLDMERGFLSYGYYYERKVRQYDKQDDIDAHRIVANEVVAQAYLALVMKRPSDARRRKYKVWGDFYDQIFSGQVVEPYVIAYQVFEQTSRWLQASGLPDSDDDVARKLAKNGSFHLARIACHLWRNGDEWRQASDELKEQIEELEKEPNKLSDHIPNAFNIFDAVVKAKPNYIADLDVALKSYELDRDVSAALHKM